MIHKIYTVDVETSWILEDRSSCNLTGKQHYNQKINERLENIVKIRDPNFKMVVQFKQDPELVQLFKHVPKKIIAYYRKMWGFYSRGEWKKAKKGLGKIVKRRS